MKIIRILLLLTMPFVALNIPLKARSFELKNRIGICNSVDKASVLKDAGCCYVEISVAGFLMPEKGDEEFQTNLDNGKASVLPITSANCFFPGGIRLVGPDADKDVDRVLKYTDVAMRRASIMGIKTVVLGSGGARRIPEGFSREEARQQFINICKRMAPIAAKYGVTIVIEPLRSQETNFINTVLEGLDIVKAVKHPNLQCLADLYHMAQEGESPRSIIRAGKHLRHVHVAEKEHRTAPGVEGDDFTPYLRALARIKYKGDISLECGWKDIKQEAGPALKEMKRQINIVNNK